MAKIHARRRTNVQTVTDFEITRATEAVAEGIDLGCFLLVRLFWAAVGARGYGTGDLANQNNHVTLVFEPLSGDVLFLVDQTNHSDRWRWIDHTRRTLVV